MPKAKRPKSIRWFERLFYLGLVLAGLNATVIAETWSAHPDPTGWGFGAFVGYALVATAINLLLLWLIAYRGSNFGRWVFVGLVLLSMSSMLGNIRLAHANGDLSFMLTAFQNLLCAAEILLLLVPKDSIDWFAGIRPVDPNVFD
jgi:hypothetical protein